MRHTRMLAVAAGLAVAAVCGANTYTVTSTADSGAGTLRQAILDANANPGADTIAFNIAGSGVHTIAPASALPAITGPVTIDGYTQSGSSANTNPTGPGAQYRASDRDRRHEREAPRACLEVQADDVTIRGLAINRHAGFGILTTGAHQNFVVEGCFIGTNAAGTQALEPYGGALSVRNHTNARIGGTTPAARNLDLGRQLSAATRSTLARRTTSATGHRRRRQPGRHRHHRPRQARPERDGGRRLLSSGSNNAIGGTSAARAQRLRSDQHRDLGRRATGNFIQGNFIGIDVTGTIVLGCYSSCIQFNSQKQHGRRLGAPERATASAARSARGSTSSATERSCRATSSAPTRPGTAPPPQRPLRDPRSAPRTSRSAASAPAKATSSPTTAARRRRGPGAKRHDPRQLHLRQPRHPARQRPRDRPARRQPPTRRHLQRRRATPTPGRTASRTIRSSRR